MISKLTGVVAEKDSDYLIVEVGEIGYKVNVSPDVVAKAKEKEEISLFTYLAVRENSLDLYGFLGKGELVFFELLVSVSGIGPKGALGVLSQATPIQLETSITTGDCSILTKVSGIGEKTAERIILELKNKIGKISSLQGSARKDSNVDVETMEALLALGYSQRDAQEALREIGSKTKNVNEKIKRALKILGR